MPSLADIPDDLKAPEHKPAFVEWVLDLRVDFHTKRALAHLWCSLTRTALSTEEWAKLEKNQPEE